MIANLKAISKITGFAILTAIILCGCPLVTRAETTADSLLTARAESPAGISVFSDMKDYHRSDTVCIYFVDDTLRISYVYCYIEKYVDGVWMRMTLDTPPNNPTDPESTPPPIFPQQQHEYIWNQSIFNIENGRAGYHWSGFGRYRAKLQCFMSITGEQIPQTVYSNEFYIVYEETAPLSLTIRASHRIITDTEPIQITISLTNNLDTPTRIYRVPLQWPEYHVVTPAGDTFIFSMWPGSIYFPMYADYPWIQTHLSYSSHDDWGDWPNRCFQEAGIYKVQMRFAQPEHGEFYDYIQSVQTEIPTPYVVLIPVDIVSNVIELEKK